MENCNNTIFLETFIYNVEKKITEKNRGVEWRTVITQFF